MIGIAVNNNMKYVNCNICGSDEYRLFREIDGCRLVRCRLCGLVYVNPRRTRWETGDEYSASYHIERLLGYEPGTEEEIEKEIGKNIGRAEEIVRECGMGGRLLDVGCGAGFFIACLRRYGWEVEGVDVSEWAARFAREKLGLSVFTGRVEDIDFDRRFDVITLFHLLEHLPDPLGTLKKIGVLMAPDGTLVVKGPNLAGFDRIWHGKDWRGYDIPFHLYDFTPKTYQIMLEKAGFSIQKKVFQYWNPIAHLKEIKLGDGIRADHPPEAIRKLGGNRRYNNFIFKGIKKVGFTIAKLLRLKGRDITIYARKRCSL